MSNLPAVTDETFDEKVLQSNLPVLVDFWAEWCGPCRKIAPILEELAPNYANKVQFVKLNVEENNDTPAKYGIRGIPALLLYKGGAMIATQVGLVSKAQLSEFLDSHLS